MKITKGVILAAGYGTRVLPATKAVPKEMLNIADKPAIQYVVEELVGSGITDILVVLSRGKEAIINHFDDTPDLAQTLEAKNKTAERKSIDVLPDGVRISYIRQRKAKGTGDAVLCAESFAGDNSFVMAYADDIFIGGDNDGNPVSGQLISALQNQDGSFGAVAMKEVSDELVLKYSSLKVSHLPDNSDKVYAVSDMNEKPTLAEKFSNFSILGRCILPSTIFDKIRTLTPGAGGEIQLTDAMKELAHEGKMYGVDYEGTRYDMGSKLGILVASTEVGLSHPETATAYKDYLKNLLRDELVSELKLSQSTAPQGNADEPKKEFVVKPDDDEDLPNYFN